MVCKETKCDGEIDASVKVYLQTSCHSSSLAHPCGKCGRVHWPQGEAVFNRPGNKVFLENGVVVHRDDNNQLVA
jgi:hypothetical protein